MSNSTDGTEPWSIQRARNLYNITVGAEYFDINDAGHVVAKPLRDAGASVDLTDVIEEAKARGLKFPLLIRFQTFCGTASSPLTSLSATRLANSTIKASIAAYFRSRSTNCARWWKRSWTPASRLILVWRWAANGVVRGLAMQSQIGSLIVCNGYKDASFIRMALLGTS